ncbi:HD domain-containing phosphohydrolase [Deinococcus sp. UYEF24]
MSLRLQTETDPWAGAQATGQHSPDLHMLGSLVQLCRASGAALLLSPAQGGPSNLLLSGVLLTELETFGAQELLTEPPVPGPQSTGPQPNGAQSNGPQAGHEADAEQRRIAGWVERHSPFHLSLPVGRREGRLWLVSSEPLDLQTGVLAPVLNAWADQIRARTEAPGQPDLPRAEAAPPPTPEDRELYRLLEEHVPTLIQTFDAHWRRVYVSPSSRQILGYPPAELLGQRIDAYWHGEEHARLTQALEGAIAQGQQSVELTYRIRHADGQEHWLDSRVRFLYGENARPGQPGTFLGMVASSNDVSGKVRDEQRQGRNLQQTQSLFQLMLRLEQTHDPHSIVQIVLSALQVNTGFQVSAFLSVVEDRLQEAQVSGMSQTEFAALLEPYAELRLPLSPSPLITAKLMAGEAVQIASGQDAVSPGDHAARRLKQVLLTPVMVNGALSGVLLCATLKDEQQVQPGAELLVSIAAERLSRAWERLGQISQLKQGREETLRALGRVLEYRDHETKGHTDRVTGLAQQFGHHLGLPDDQLLHLRWGAYLHDTGKMAISDAILLKPGRLNADEFSQVQRHTDIGYTLLRAIPTLPQATLAVVRSHHERWDGRGYPEQLSGHQIPLLARVFSLVDVYDALTSERPYKPAYPVAEALAILELGAGSQFDPALTARFVELVRNGQILDQTPVFPDAG